MERANACTLPEKVCGTNVPLKTIKPGDPLWELTMLGRHGDWPKKKEPVPEPKTTTQSAKSKDDVPEWAQDDALADASITDDSFLGTALPQLTEEERLGLAGLSVKAFTARGGIQEHEDKAQFRGRASSFLEWAKEEYLQALYDRDERGAPEHSRWAQRAILFGLSLNRAGCQQTSNLALFVPAGQVRLKPAK